MNERMKRLISNIVLPVLTSIFTVLLIIPGEQGETILGTIIEMLKKLVS